MSQRPPYLTFAVSAPGKVILHGEHSVVFGKPALAASVDLRTKLSFQTAKENLNESSIELNLPCLDLHQIYNIKELTDVLLLEPVSLIEGVDPSSFSFERPNMIDFHKLLRRIDSYVKQLSATIPLSSNQKSALQAFFCLLTGMFASINLPLQKFSIDITTDMSIGSGMGSSASFGVCLSAALIHYIRYRSQAPRNETNLSRNGLKNFTFSSTDLNHFNKWERDLICHWALFSDKIMHWNPSGIDNAICTYGSIIQFKKGTDSKGPEISQLPDPKMLKILLIHTGITRNTSKMVGAVAARRNSHTVVVDYILNAISELTLSAAEILKSLAQMSDTSSAEDEISKLGELVDINQSLLQALGVSHETLDEICSIIKKAGLHGKLTGAGGGGYAYMLIPPNVYPTVIDDIKRELEAKAFKCTEVQLGGPGVILHNQLGETQ